MNGMKGIRDKLFSMKTNELQLKQFVVNSVHPLHSNHLSTLWEGGWEQ